MSQDFERPLVDIRIDQDSEETKWSMASLADLLDEEMEDMDEQQRAAWMAGKEEENNQVEEDLADLLEISSRMEKEKEGEKESEEMQQGEDM